MIITIEIHIFVIPLLENKASIFYLVILKYLLQELANYEVNRSYTSFLTPESNMFDY